MNPGTRVRFSREGLRRVGRVVRTDPENVWVVVPDDGTYLVARDDCHQALDDDGHPGALNSRCRRIGSGGRLLRVRERSARFATDADAPLPTDTEWPAWLQRVVLWACFVIAMIEWAP